MNPSCLLNFYSFRFCTQEAKHQNAEMKKKKEQEERKARALAEVKGLYTLEIPLSSLQDLK